MRLAGIATEPTSESEASNQSWLDTVLDRQ
jgi:hypothetical protein